ncbi:MAG: FHA domain-containing protein [Chthoniobacter sp.]
MRLEITDVMFASNNSRLVLGRTAELCHVVVNDSSVSKQHASLRKEGDRFLVADRNSSNRTAVNGQFNTKVFDEVPLKEGDTLTLGEVRLDFSKI